MSNDYWYKGKGLIVHYDQSQSQKRPKNMSPGKQNNYANFIQIYHAKSPYFSHLIKASKHNKKRAKKTTLTNIIIPKIITIHPIYL